MAGFTGAPPIVTDGLVFAVDAANYESYPGSGNIWYNLAGNINGVIYNNPIFDNTNGGSLSLDGTNEYINVNPTDAANFDFSTHQTIFIILKPEESDNSRRNPYSQAYGGYGTITHEPGGTFNYYHGTHGGNGGPYQGSNSNFTVNQNEIAMITFTRDPSSVKWYKNGQKVRTYSNNYPTAVNSNRPIEIGRGYVSPYLGKIYLVFLYNTTLTENQVLQNYNALKSRFNL